MVNNCGNCRFFEENDVNTGHGVCRHGPPHLIVNEWQTMPALSTPGNPLPAAATKSTVLSMSGQFPPTHRDLWCGAFDERYEKKDAN
jgi:hypothetical protein